MLPTGRDIETIAEIRRARRREADHYRLVKLTKGSPRRLKLQTLTDWVGQNLKNRLVEKSETPAGSLPATRLGEST